MLAARTMFGKESSGWLSTGVVLAALLIGSLTGSANAALILQTTDPIVTAGGNGAFDVYLLNTGGTFNVSGFSVQLSVASNSGISFTGASVGTTIAPYIFGSLQEPPLSFGSFPTTGFTASDSSSMAPGFVSLSTIGQIVGLERVSFSVAPNALAGQVAISIVPGLGTNIYDINTDPIPFTTNNGTITVTTTTAVPEPSSVAALLSGLVPLVTLAWARRKPRRESSVLTN